MDHPVAKTSGSGREKIFFLGNKKTYSVQKNMYYYCLPQLPPINSQGSCHLGTNLNKQKYYKIHITYFINKKIKTNLWQSLLMMIKDKNTKLSISHLNTNSCGASRYFPLDVVLKLKYNIEFKNFIFCGVGACRSKK